MPQPLRTDVRGGDESGSSRGAVKTTLLAFLAALVAFLSPALVTSAHAASAPTDFAGVGNWSWPTAAQSAQLGSSGVHTFRANLAWDWVEHQQGIRTWGGVDDLMTNASRNGYQLLLVLNGCVAWACGGQTRTAPTSGPGLTAYQDFVRDATSRYGAGGTFWTSHPGLTPAPVNWQVWNEVNVGVDWPNPTAGSYAAFLAQISGTIKSVDPSARVVGAGLAEYPAIASGATMVNFLTGLEQDPNFRSSADVVAVHGYAENPAGTIRILDNAKRIMRAAGDNRPIWITELGWGDGPTAETFNVGAANVAAYLRQTYDTMVACRTRWGLDRAIWFSLGDVSAAALGEPDYWGLHTGLYDVNGNPKPVLAAFNEYAGGREIPDGRASSCALPGGADPAATANAGGASNAVPQMSVVQVPKFVGAKSAGAKVDFVSDMGNSGHAECSLDGASWTVCATPYAIPRTREGAHTLQIRAVNAYGVVGPAVSASWTVDLTAPTTVFEKTPKRVVRQIVAARFGVRAAKRSSAQAGVASFQCSLNQGAWKKCTARYRVKAKRMGKGTLRVRAVDQAGNVDSKGATAKFTVAALH